MSYERVKANLNMYAVLQNLEDLVRRDPAMAALSKNWRVSIEFIVAGGPRACLAFADGQCTFHRGKAVPGKVKLFFISCAHFNKMMDGKANPIPVKGVTRLPFLTREFSRLTDALEYYLKPTAARLQDPEYLALNTRMTLNTAVFAAKEIAELDKTGTLAAAHIRDGAVLLKILPDGPAAHLLVKDQKIFPGKNECDAPMACMYLKDMQVANAFLNNKMDPFSAIAAGEVIIRGQTPMLDALSLVLDRIPVYLS